MKIMSPAPKTTPPSGRIAQIIAAAANANIRAKLIREASEAPPIRKSSRSQKRTLRLMDETGMKITILPRNRKPRPQVNFPSEDTFVSQERREISSAAESVSEILGRTNPF